MLVYNVYVMYILSRVEKLGILTLLLNCRRLFKGVSCYHLSDVIVRSIRNIHVGITINHIQISRSVLRCVVPTSAHILPISIVNKVTSA